MFIDSIKKLFHKDGEKKLRVFLPADILIVAAVIFFSVLPFVFMKSSTDATVNISWHGEVIYRGKLNVDKVVTTPDGLNTITIKDGRAYMSDASCRDGICMNSGCANSARPVICLPNRVIIFIEHDDEVDGVSW